jgi:hypothetical protein
MTQEARRSPGEGTVRASQRGGRKSEKVTSSDNKQTTTELCRIVSHWRKTLFSLAAATECMFSV